MYEVEKNVPMSSFYGKWALIASDMAVGDSVVVADSKEVKSLKQALHHHYQTRGISIKTGAQQQADGTYRVWRLKPVRKHSKN
tara:strand:- start:261 stop:509 length:249 start_codon:yes stop_codon:yes gene_type:complete